MENVAFIINPFSAGKDNRSLLNKIRQHLPKSKFYLSDSVEGTNRFICENWQSTAVFVAVGGDGTISSVAKNLAGSDKVLAIYPAGSGNGFANETGFSKDLLALINKLKRRKTQKVDTLTVNGKLAINVAGTGFDAAVAGNFEKTNRGFFNYVKVTAQTFFKYKPVEINFNSRELQFHNGSYLMVNFANTRQFGNNALIAPQALMDDGLLDIVLVKKFPLGYGVKFALRMFLGTLRKDRYVTFLKTANVEFTVSTEEFHLDGEHLLLTSPVKIEVQPKNLTVLV